MTNIKLNLARILLIASGVSVFLTVIIPGKKVAIGNLFSPSYNGIYSVVALCVFLSAFFALTKQVKMDMWINRFKFCLSCTFLLSLISNILFL